LAYSSSYTLSNGLSGSTTTNEHTAQGKVSKGMIRRKAQHPSQRGLGHDKMLVSLIGKEASADYEIETAMPTFASIFPGSRDSGCSKKARASAICSGVHPLLHEALPWKHKSI
jgi:hypothetical protein